MDPLGTFMQCFMIYGAFGLFAIGLAERFLPVMPSYGMLLAVGVAAADGVWMLPTAIVATSLGSVVGCAACFHLVQRVGEARASYILDRIGRLLRMPPDRLERRKAAYRRNRTALAFSFQLLPTVRLLAPTFAALIPGDIRGFLVASAAGIAVWNGLFISVGFLASRTIADANATALALVALGCLLAAHMLLFWSARSIRRRRKPLIEPQGSSRRN